DGLLLVGTNNVNYATGACPPGLDSGRAALMRQVAVVVRGDGAPHLFTPFPDAAPPELPADHLHVGLHPEPVELFPHGSRVGVDEVTASMGGLVCVGASAVLGPAKIAKTPDELACIRTAQRINELAMRDVQPLLGPEVRQTDLTATFLRRIFELGATSNAIDPIWQIMPTTKAEGPWTVHGDVAFPTPTTGRAFQEGDVVWVDTGITYEGYASDFGRTWLVGADQEPTPRQRAQYERWRAVVDAVVAIAKPGVSALDLGRTATAANDGVTPWLAHFYLAHSVGTDSAEMPLIGTDLGQTFDSGLVLAPGMVLVIEPVIWDDGAAGYRSEDIIAITDGGSVPLSDYPYDPW
ncbi:MAG TPA: M24 family metallopeptidase, partial [Acidimicrobiales bacterium]|nr:M24 family metallopeptidase [Acidimicrobiales bacterium]